MTHAQIPVPRTAARWSPWRVVVLVVVSLAGVVAASGCALAWLLMGFMGTPVRWWEPVAYPAGLVASVAVPVLVGRVLGGGRGQAWWRWGVLGTTATGLVVFLLAVSVLGASA